MNILLEPPFQEVVQGNVAFMWVWGYLVIWEGPQHRLEFYSGFADPRLREYGQVKGKCLSWVVKQLHVRRVEYKIHKLELEGGEINREMVSFRSCLSMRGLVVEWKFASNVRPSLFLTQTSLSFPLDPPHSELTWTQGIHQFSWFICFLTWIVH